MQLNNVMLQYFLKCLYLHIFFITKKKSNFLQNTDFKPVPLKVGEDVDYMLALKQEMRGVMQRLPHNIKAQSSRAGEERSGPLES